VPSLRRTPLIAAALSCLLAAALLVQLTQAGRSYLYCQAMQVEISQPCCAHAGAAAQTREHAVAVPADCCQVRKAPAVAAFTYAAPSALLSPPPVALAVSFPELVSSVPALARVERVTPRAGPPPARARAQFMVFLI
jgi:hypothetical protein